MSRYILLPLFFFFVSINSTESQVVSGPMLGPIEYRDAKIWIEVTQHVKSVSLQYKKKGDTKTKTVLYRGQLGNDFNPLQITVGGLEFNTTYEYQFIIDGLNSFPNCPLYKIAFVFVSPFFLYCSETDFTCCFTSIQIFASLYSTGPSIGPETTCDKIEIFETKKKNSENKM